MDRVAGSAPVCCVHIGRVGDLLPSLLPPGRTIVISDSNIDRRYGPLLAPYEHILIGIGEQAKTLATVESVCRTLSDMGADRNCFILGIGGGVVTDVAGFVASVYMRGVRFGFVSTTLLGQVDAGVGGKNGVNLDGYKNMIGTFTQPEFVVCDVTMFATLPEREFRSGLAEVIKSAIVGDAELFAILERCDLNALRSDMALMEDIVRRSVQVKSAIVAADERESGERRKLNLGHTLAHAIEQKSRTMTHGEAVAVGLACIADAALRRGMLGAEDCGRIKSLLERFGFVSDPPVPMPRLLAAMHRDKKRDGDSLHMIMPVRIGDVRDVVLSYGEIERLFAGQ